MWRDLFYCGRMDELLTVNQVAKQLLVSESTVRRWIRLDLIEASRLPSGRIRIGRSAIEALRSIHSAERQRSEATNASGAAR